MGSLLLCKEEQARQILQVGLHVSIQGLELPAFTANPAGAMSSPEVKGKLAAERKLLHKGNDFMYEHKKTVGGGMTEMEKRKQEKMAELKEKLYKKFGNNINLEE